MLRRILSETERNVLTMAGAGSNNASIDTQLRLSPGTAEEMLPRIRRKVEAAARQHRDERARRIRIGDELKCACGETFIARSLSQRKCPACRVLGPEVPERDIVDAALDAAGVSAEQAGTIREDAAGGDPSVQGPPIPPAASESEFDDEPEEPAVAEEVAAETTSNGNGDASSMNAMRAAAVARRERILELLGAGDRSVKCLSVELDVGLDRVREDLALLEAGEKAERAGRNAWDWPGAPGEGQRSGKPSVVWRLWTGNGAPKEGRRVEAPPEPPAEPEPEPDPETPAREPEPARAVSSEQVVELPRDRRELHWFYLGVLFELARIRPEAAHVFDRIERLMADGPPEGGTAP